MLYRIEYDGVQYPTNPNELIYGVEEYIKRNFDDGIFHIIPARSYTHIDEEDMDEDYCGTVTRSDIVMSNIISVVYKHDDVIGERVYESSILEGVLTMDEMIDKAKSNTAWCIMLNEHFCSTDERGCRPCDMGCPCDSCSFNSNTDMWVAEIIKRF